MLGKPSRLSEFIKHGNDAHPVLIGQSLGNGDHITHS
jgi:hypothetical protein